MTYETWRIVVLPDEGIVTELKAYDSIQALELFQQTHGIVGQIERDEHRAILNGDRLVYAALGGAEGHKRGCGQLWDRDINCTCGAAIL